MNLKGAPKTTTQSPHTFRVSSNAFETDGRQCRVGDVVDLRHVGPERVRKLVASRLVLPEKEFQRGVRAARLDTLKDQQREAMERLGRTFSDRLRHEVAAIEQQHNDARDSAVSALRAELIAERDAATRLLLDKYRSEARAIADADDEPPTPA